MPDSAAGSGDRQGDSIQEALLKAQGAELGCCANLWSGRYAVLAAPLKPPKVSYQVNQRFLNPEATARRQGNRY